jgi:hypothetical protein
MCPAPYLRLPNVAEDAFSSDYVQSPLLLVTQTLLHKHMAQIDSCVCLPVQDNSRAVQASSASSCQQCLIAVQNIYGYCQEQLMFQPGCDGCLQPH